MNEKEFETEMHDYLKEKYAIFSELRTKISNLFDQFHAMCKENDIRYFIGYGSLLGEIRDGGQIPWDYDMDVCMPFSDYVRFKSIFLDSKDSGLVLQDNFTKLDSPFFEARIGFCDYPLELVHLDIFYCISLPNDKKLIKLRKQVKKMFILRMYKSYLKYKKTDDDVKLFKARKIYYLINHPFLTLKTIDKRFQKLLKKYPFDSFEMVLPINFVDTVYSKTDVEPLQLVNLHNKEMFLPNNPESVLNQCYKNYLEYLPIESRFEEFYKWVVEYNKISGFKQQDYRKR